jgi:hypothetical protein
MHQKKIPPTKCDKLLNIWNLKMREKIVQISIFKHLRTVKFRPLKLIKGVLRSSRHQKNGRPKYQKIIQNLVSNQKNNN